MLADTWLHPWWSCYIDQILHVSVVTVNHVGGILDEVQYDIIEESFAGPLEHTEYGTSTNNHSVSDTYWGIGNFHQVFSLEDGLWRGNPELTTFLIEYGSGNCCKLMLQHVIQVNRSSTHQSQATLFHSSFLVAFLHGNNLPLDRLIESCGTSRLKFLQLGFANDTKLFRKVKEIGDKQKLQDDIDELVKWSEKWQLLFNFGKCKCLHTGSGNTGVNYEMGGTILSKTVKEKDLGVTMNANMKVSEQCRIAASKGNQVLGMIRRNITYKEKSLIIPLYKAIVRPHLEYCIGPTGMESIS